MHTTNPSEQTPDYEAIKAKQRATWGSGDYGRVGVTLQITGEELCEALDVRAGQRARRFCKVVSTDYLEQLLEQSQARARAEGLVIDCQHADAEDLPFDDASFDHVVSTFGAMFAPNQARASAELLRVCRPGGRIGLTNWTPEGFIGQLFKTVGRYVPPPAGLDSPTAWGTEVFLRERFGDDTQSIKIDRRTFCFRYESPRHWLDVFTRYYGPTLKAYAALDDEHRDSLGDDILALIARLNTANDGSMVVPSEYLEVVIDR